MASGEKPALEERRAALGEQIKFALLPKDAMDERNVIVEIRAGTGGDEASLVCGRSVPHVRAASPPNRLEGRARLGSDGSMGGYKEVIAEIPPAAGCLRQAQIRIGRASRAARARYRRLGAAFTLDRDRCGAAEARMSTSRSTRPTSRSIRCGRAAPAVSTSTKTESAVRV